MRVFALFLLLVSSLSQADTKYQPFIMGNAAGETLEAATQAVSEKLTAAGFEVVGILSPYQNDTARIIGFTSPALKAAASTVVVNERSIGGFGAVLRAAVTNNNGKIEVTYTNPVYVGYAYRMGDLSAIADALKNALGASMTFGAQGKTQKELENYKYAVMMPTFKDVEVIARFNSHEEAVNQVAAALENPQAELSLAWQAKVDAEQTVFGVQLHRGPWENDKIYQIMQKVDVSTPRATAALPWELLVSGNQVLALKGKYRLAVMFPDLSMGTFMQVQEVPGDMSNSARQVVKTLAGGK